MNGHQIYTQTKRQANIFNHLQKQRVVLNNVTIHLWAEIRFSPTFLHFWDWPIHLSCDSSKLWYPNIWIALWFRVWLGNNGLPSGYATAGRKGLRTKLSTWRRRHTVRCSNRQIDMNLALLASTQLRTEPAGRIPRMVERWITLGWDHKSRTEWPNHFHGCVVCVALWI